MTQRLERLQQAVAELEVDRSKLQCHNAQLRTTLEQVGNFCSLPWGPVDLRSTLLFLKHFIKLQPCFVYGRLLSAPGGRVVTELKQPTQLASASKA